MVLHKCRLNKSGQCSVNLKSGRMNSFKDRSQNQTGILVRIGAEINPSFNGKPKASVS